MSEKIYKLKYCDGAKHDKSFVNLRVYVEERESNSSDYDGVEEGVLEGIIINIFGAAASSKFIDSENANK